MSLIEKTVENIKPQDADFRARATERLDKLTMPHWALGGLMDLALELAGMTRSMNPPVSRKTVITMAGDHGVADEGVSAYPQEVTAQMVGNFVHGGAGINALARLAGAKVCVVDMGVASDLKELSDAGKIISKRIAAGTCNIANGPAMTREQVVRAVEAGIEIAQQLSETTDIFATGDMGIANTTPSTAIAAVITGKNVEELAGRGTGISDEQVEKKIAVVKRAIEVNKPDPSDGLDVLAKVGGFEIGGLVGVILSSASQSKPVLIDGFISTAAALIAQAICPTSMEYVIAAHRSVERGHMAMQEKLSKRPLLDLDMRLGEGTGAVLAMNLVEAAVRILTEVATFDEAGVSEADE